MIGMVLPLIYGAPVGVAAILASGSALAPRQA